MGEHQTSQTQEITVILILDVDGPPGILPSPHSLATLVLHHHVATDHGKGYQLVSTLFGLIIWEVVNIYLVFIKLAQDLQFTILRGIFKPQVQCQQLCSFLSCLITDNYLLFEGPELLLCAGVTLTNNWNYVHLNNNPFSLE